MRILTRDDTRHGEQYVLLDDAMAEIAVEVGMAAAVPQNALTDEQIAALTIMLDHFSGDPRTECLRPLVYGPNVRAKAATTAAQENEDGTK